MTLCAEELGTLFHFQSTEHKHRFVQIIKSKRLRQNNLNDKKNCLNYTYPKITSLTAASQQLESTIYQIQGVPMTKAVSYLRESQSKPTITFLKCKIAI